MAQEVTDLENFDTTRKDGQNDKNENKPETSVELTENELYANDLRIMEMTEILENTFRHMSTKSLKTARLVCKIWNIESVRFLQRRTRVSLDESNSEDLKEFCHLFKSWKLSKSPLPFKKFRVSVVNFGKNLMDILNHPEVCVVTLLINKSPTGNNTNFQKCLYETLVKHSTIQLFRCALKSEIDLGWSVPLQKDDKVSSCDAEPNETPMSRAPLSLPGLTDFGFWESDRQSKSGCVDFLCDMINAAPNLTHLVTGSDDENVFLEIVKRTDLHGVNDLYMENVTKSHLVALTSIKMPTLRSLTVQANCLRIDEHRVNSEVLKSLVANFRETIEDLSISWMSNSSDGDFVECPKLKKISIDGWNGSLDVFNPRKVPSLKSFRMQGHLEIQPEFDLCPHSGVLKFAIESNTQDTDALDQQELDEEHFCLFEYVHGQVCHFGELCQLDLTLPISNELVVAIIQIFPRLEGLILDTELSISEHIFSGVNKLTLERHLRKGIDVDEAVRTTSLRDLKNLKTLVLARYDHSGMYLTNNAIKYGLARMSALKVLQINWNSQLSIEIVKENLDHLDRLIVNNSCTFEPFNVLNTLKGRMTQLELQSQHWDD